MHLLHLLLPVPSHSTHSIIFFIPRLSSLSSGTYMIQLAHVLIVDIASIDADRCSLDVSIIEDVPCKVK